MEKKEVWDLLGKPSSKFDFKVKYTTPSLAALKEENIIPSGWGDEFAKENEVITIPLPDALCVMGINICALWMIRRSSQTLLLRI